MKDKFNKSAPAGYDAALAAARGGDILAFKDIRAVTPLQELQRPEIFIAAMHSGATAIATISAEDCNKLGFIEQNIFSRHLWSEIVAAGNTDFARIALDAGIIPADEACFGMIAEKGNVALFELVRQKQVRITRGSMQAALKSAACAGQADCVSYLLDAFDLHMKNYILVSAMEGAINHGHTGIALHIAQKACTRTKPGAIDKVDRTHIDKVLCAVVRSPASDLLPCLLQYHQGSFEVLLRHAAAKKDPRALDFLLDEAIRRKQLSLEEVRSPLLTAVNAGAVDCLHSLLSKAVDITRCDDVPLRVGLFYAQSDIMNGGKMLLMMAQAGADAGFIIKGLREGNIGSEDLIAQIAGAGETFHRKSLQRLETALSSGRDISDKDDALGMSPLLFAARCNILRDLLVRVDKRKLTAELFLADDAAVLDILVARERLPDLLDTAVWAERAEQASHILAALAQRHPTSSSIDAKAFMAGLARETLNRKSRSSSFIL